MPATRFTVIVPVLRFEADEPVLVSLRNHVPTSGPAQIIVAEGRHPARQRNAALARAEGEIIVFLDNDCQLAPDFWTVLETALARPEVEIIGGPALLRTDATGAEKIFHALLAHPLVAGPVAARYAARGDFRATTQTELILCNLAARRGIFDRVGPLSTDLYPNEENEWLDRAQAVGVGIYYDPALRVFRPQRATGFQLLRMLVRYGIGRTRQLHVSGWRVSLHQALPLAVVLPFLLLVCGHAGRVTYAILWLIAAVIVAATCPPTLTIFQRLVAGAIAPLLPLAYAVGQIVGWFTLGQGEKTRPPAPILYDERGAQLYK